MRRAPGRPGLRPCFPSGCACTHITSNALTPRAQVDDARAAAFDARAAAVAEAAGVLAGVRLTASAWVRAGVAVCEDGARTSAAQLLARPQMALGAVRFRRRCADGCRMGRGSWTYQFVSSIGERTAQRYLRNQAAGGTCRQRARSRALHGAAAVTVPPLAAGAGSSRLTGSCVQGALRQPRPICSMPPTMSTRVCHYGDAEQHCGRIFCREEPSRPRASALRSWRRAPQRRAPRARRRSARWRRAACATRRSPPLCTTATTRPTPGARRGRGPPPRPALERARLYQAHGLTGNRSNTFSSALLVRLVRVCPARVCSYARPPRLGRGCGRVTLA